MRAALVWFFNLTIFGDPARQIASCVVIGLAVYALSVIPIKTKAI